MTVEKEPIDQENFIRDRQFCTRARDGFRHLLSRTWPGGGARVVLPAYIGHSPLEGSGILDPLIELRIPYSFYRVDERLNIDLSSLERELGRGRVFSVLAIHYFGRVQAELAEARGLCQRAGAALIEDCCHCMDLSGRGIGDVGDYALFSIHKVLPCDDGGILQRNHDAPDPGPLPHDARAEALPNRLWRDAAFDAIAERRADNYRRLSAELQGLDGFTPFWAGLPEGTAPLNLPILIDDADRFEVYKRMRASGVGVVSLYHTLVDAIDPDVFPTSHDISRKILNLPIHQDVQSGDMRSTVEALRSALTAR
jgi:dTDP-4-amino-4,6-dideoxygalactose transaminase